MTRYKKYFSQALKMHFPDSEAALMTTLEDHYKVIAKDTAFAAASGNPIDKRLDFCACFLALIKTLDQHGESFGKIREISLEVVTAFVQPENKLSAWVKRIPLALIQWPFSSFLLTLFHKKVSKKGNEAGFRAHIITDKKETYGLGYGVDILECGICKLFQKHHYLKYASILCEVDEITSGLAGLQLIRTGTIALGAEKCDFRFRKANEADSQK
ncbi:MAG: L-2-amino-thiazoline-4-carboxylic acid hydrolase [Spirosomataceae bacterium]